MDNKFDVGIIVKPQGICGELRVLPTTDDPERFSLLDEIYIRPKAATQQSAQVIKLLSARLHKGFVLLKLAGVNDRNAAEKLVGSVLSIPPEKALPLGEDEYFIRDLVGLTVYTEDGQTLGEIASVFPTGANDVYIVRNEAGESFMLPAIKDVVLAVSIAERKMTVRLMEGLLELKA